MTGAAPPAPPPRIARLVLATPDGRILGALPPLQVATPWWQDAAPVVAAVRAAHGIDVTILRLIATERAEPHGGAVTYLAETDAPVDAEPWTGTLDDHPLRLPYARPGGPAADLAWATAALDDHGIALSGRPQQIRSWNLSSIWRIPTARGDAWLKVVPPFFAHEGRMLAALAGGPVPPLIASAGGRVLMGNVPGVDMYEAGADDHRAMIRLLVGLQKDWLDRTDELRALGLPDWRAEALPAAIAATFERTADALTPEERATLGPFIATLPARFAAVAACGIGDTLVHGDFHPGNLRGGNGRLTLLDWGDCGIGHPLLDQPAFLEVMPPGAADEMQAYWSDQWRAAVPGSDPDRAANLLAPVAAARQAVIYRGFLDGIEPSERIYHAHDPANWLKRAAELVTREDRASRPVG